MTPVPIELPLRPSEAAGLADLIFEHVEGRPLTDDLRNRLAGRAATLSLGSLRAFFGSLEPDPVHSSAYFLAVDGLALERPEPLLLYFAPSTAPVSALFPKPLLIGRMRPGGGREIIINATPFGASDHATVEAYASQAGRSFLPRPQGILPALSVETDAPAKVGPSAFQTFRSLHKTTGRNLAAFTIPASAGLFWETVWTAIRVGYREGYSIGGPYSEETAPLFTRFAVNASRAVDLSQTLRGVRAGAPADLEVDLSAAGPAEATVEIERLKEAGCAMQWVRLDAGMEQLAEACAAVIAAGAIPSFRIQDPSNDQLAAIRAASHGRYALTLPMPEPDPEAIIRCQRP